MPTVRSNRTSIPKRRPSFGKSKGLELPSTLSSDIFRIFQTILLTFCRRIIFAPPTLKILVYFTLIILGPFLKDFHTLSQTSISSKANILNQYTTNLGWTWSILLLIPFVYLTSLIYTHAHYPLILRHLIRLLIATFIWYIITWIFNHFETLTGMCLPISRYPWQDGHRFFLLYGLLVINEEVQFYDDNWDKMQMNIDNNLINQTRLRFLSKPIGLLYFSLAILTVLWEFMLLSTVLDIYNILHKILAASFAVLFWFLTYKIWFKSISTSKLAPCAPGDGFRNFAI